MEDFPTRLTSDVCEEEKRDVLDHVRDSDVKLCGFFHFHRILMFGTDERPSSGAPEHSEVSLMPIQTENSRGSNKSRSVDGAVKRIGFLFFVFFFLLVAVVWLFEYAENRLGAALNHSPVVLGHKSLAEPSLHAEDGAFFFLF